jgi:hypothetical protein
MPLQRLAFAVALAVLAVIAVACPSSTCGPTNCGGCCGSDGKCVSSPSNGNNTTCGNNGGTCADCTKSAQACTASFTCGSVSGTGGGSGGTGGGAEGCNSSNCNGCCVGTVCIPLTAETVGNCGKSGAACGACAAGLTCQNGTCQGTMTVANVGDPCAVDADCASLGTGAICKLTTSTGSGTYPEGYCTKDCTADSQCPSTDAGPGVCVSLNAAYGENDKLCWEPCNQRNHVPGGCRSGYACYGLSNNGQPIGNGCWIYPLPSPDAGPASDKLGNPCTGFMDCANPPDPQFAVCITANFKLADGGMGTPTGYTGGYCSADCSVSHSVCGDAGVCFVNFPQSGDRSCAELCPTPSTGQGLCRTGYVCTGYFVTQPDGGAVPSINGYCAPDCFQPGADCGDAGYCDAGYCLGFTDAG